jgi:predicted alpha/beta superfamily hydrolase
MKGQLNKKQIKKQLIMKTSINKYTVKFILSLLFLFGQHARPLHAQVTDSTQLPGIELKVFESKILNEKRKIRIQVPAGMKSWDSYPVLYVLDGEAQTTMTAGQVQYLSESYKIIPNLIVVGIENTDRIRDLTPTHHNIGPDGKPDTSARAFGRNSGGGEKFLQFIREELMPYIQRQYHPAPYNILAGHSLGGLMALYCLVNHPEYFNAYIAISPSLQWDNKVMLQQAAQKLNASKTADRILFFSDANEDSAFHQNQVELLSLLQKKNVKGFKFTHAFYPNETHISEPVKAFYDGIRFVYPEWHLPYNSSAFKKAMSSKIIKDHYLKLSASYNYNVVPLHDEMIAIGRFLRNDPSRIKDAVELLEWNAANYPASKTALETLGDTYLKIEDQKNALLAYQKAAAIDPSNTALADKIKQLNN